MGVVWPAVSLAVSAFLGHSLDCTPGLFRCRFQAAANRNRTNKDDGHAGYRLCPDADPGECVDVYHQPHGPLWDCGSDDRQLLPDLAMHPALPGNGCESGPEGN